MKLHIINKTKEKEYKDDYPELRKYFKLAFKKLELKGDFEISLILVGPEEIHQINRDYRNIDRETDVISFAEIDGDEHLMESEDTIYLGDIFINVDRVKSQALEYEHSEKRELVFLFVHGLLHCLGYDHMCEEDEKVMISKQKLILGDLK